MTRRIEAALSYARRGWHIFPAPPETKKSYKSAELNNGRRWGMTRDEEEIKSDFARWPDANIGIPAGIDNKFWVLEADTPQGHSVDGIANLRELQREHGHLPDTLIAESPSGSLHYYFTWPGEPEIRNSTSAIRPGIDVRAEGGMVIAPPSTRHDGEYRWLNDHEIVAAPEWLVRLARDATRRRSGAEPGLNEGGPGTHRVRSAGSSSQCWESIAIIRALDGNLHSGMCRCPCHNDRTPSLHVDTSSDGRPLLHCFAGCSQQAVIAWCKTRGLWSKHTQPTDPKQPEHLEEWRRRMDRAEDDHKRLINARALLKHARYHDQDRALLKQTKKYHENPDAQQQLLRYLNGRGIDRIPSGARWLPQSQMASLANRWPDLGLKPFPAMVQMIGTRSAFRGALLTYLTADNTQNLRTTGKASAACTGRSKEGSWWPPGRSIPTSR